MYICVERVRISIDYRVIIIRRIIPVSHDDSIMSCYRVWFSHHYRTITTRDSISSSYDSSPWSRFDIIWSDDIH